MESLKERTIRQSFTEEFAREIAGSVDGLRESLERHAAGVENSINGVIMVHEPDSGFGGPVLEVVCIKGHSADEDVIKRSIEYLQARVYRESDD